MKTVKLENSILANNISNALHDIHVHEQVKHADKEFSPDMDDFVYRRLLNIKFLVKEVLKKLNVNPTFDL